MYSAHMWFSLRCSRVYTHRKHLCCVLSQCFLTWAWWSLCSTGLWISRLSPSGESTVCLRSPNQDWVDFERLWNAPMSLLKELCLSVKPCSVLVWKVWYRSSNLLLSFTRADCWSGLLCKVDTSWLRASVLTLWGNNMRSVDDQLIVIHTFKC